MSDVALERAPYFIVVDLFCGGGGLSEGFKRAKLAKHCPYYFACAVNHDAQAIATHTQNHPETIHYTEDVRDWEVVEKIRLVVDALRAKWPSAHVLLHASLECTNYSNAKGGKERDADSRSLANHMPLYLEAFKPDYFTVENVREFMSWGPLGEDKKPLSRSKGIDYIRWWQQIEGMGYVFRHRLLNAADYGSRQSRLRFFGVFAKPGLPVQWPTQTHSKGGKVAGTLPWLAVRPLLELAEKGDSIFAKRPKSGKLLSDNTYRRIYAGLVKFCGAQRGGFVSNPAWFGGDAALDGAAPTVVASQHKAPLGLVQTAFIQQYNSGSDDNRVKDLEATSPVVTTENRFGLVQTQFLDSQYGTGGPISLDGVAPAVTTCPKSNLVKAEFLAFTAQYYGSGDNVQSLDTVAPTVVTNDRVALLQAVPGAWTLTVDDVVADSWLEKCLTFCQANGIADVFMRMLYPIELARIQGFGDEYRFTGSQTQIKKHIGNAVDVTMAKALGQALADGVHLYKRIREGQRAIEIFGDEHFFPCPKKLQL
jgi:DNA (cytosine-5)-methyltransferase 1